jgi:2-keto-3-deoxy-L-rhamnonate aldolase RhmA
MRRNTFRELLNAGKPTIGTHIHSSWPNVIEAVGQTGMFDYIEFVAEYASFDLFLLENLCRAAELHNLSTMIKLDQQPRAFLAQRSIGCGFQSVLFADCRTIDDARECVRAVRPDTPEDGGIHGVGTRRNSYMGYGGTPDYVQALRDIVVVLMVEKKPFVDNLDQILSEVKGIDMVQWGPADLAMSMGRPGDWYHPDLKQMERDVIKLCQRHNVPMRIEINSPEAAKYYLDLGIKDFCIGTDLMIIYDWMKTNGEGLRKVIDGA